MWVAPHVVACVCVARDIYAHAVTSMCMLVTHVYMFNSVRAWHCVVLLTYMYMHGNRRIGINAVCLAVVRLPDRLLTLLLGRNFE